MHRGCAKGAPARCWTASPSTWPSQSRATPSATLRRPLQGATALRRDGGVGSYRPAGCTSCNQRPLVSAHEEYRLSSVPLLSRQIFCQNVPEYWGSAVSALIRRCSILRPYVTERDTQCLGSRAVGDAERSACHRSFCQGRLYVPAAIIALRAARCGRAGR